MNEAFALVERVIARYVDSPAPLTEDTLLGDGLGLTSFELVYIVCDLEDALGVDLSDWDLYSFRTVGDLVSELAPHCRAAE